MTEFTPDKIAEDVLRLDQAATPGPWVAELREACTCRRPENHGRVTHEGALVAALYGALRPAADATLIAAYRVDAPILAREVNHLRQELCRTELLRQQAVEDLWKAQQQGEVPYRPGLPSVEQVRAHASRGGWWMRRLDDGVPVVVYLCAFQRADETWQILWHPNTASPKDGCIWTSPDEPHSYRPCLPDGTPYPWGDL